MDDKELLLLVQFAVLRNIAYREQWTSSFNMQAFHQLLERRLLILHDNGSVELLPAYRSVIYNAVPTEKRNAAHQWAVAFHTVLASYTEASYHLVQIGKIEQAIVLWHWHEQAEINQGQAGAAYRIFQAIDSSKLAPKIHQSHQLIKARLARLIGNPQQALLDLRSALWKTPTPEVEALNLQGILANDQGEIDDSRHFFKLAIEQAERLVEARLAHAHKGLAWAYRAEFAMKSAWREAKLAQYEADNIQGLIQEDLANYVVARTYYDSALNLAIQLDYRDGIAKTANNLILLLGKFGEFTKAREMYTLAYGNYQAIGKVHSLVIAQVNLGFNSLLAGDYPQALATLTDINQITEQYKFDLSAHLSAFINLAKAESFAGLQQLEAAEEYSQRTINAEFDELMPDCYRVMSEICSKRGQLPDAQKWLQYALDLHTEMNEPDPFTKGYLLRSLAIVQKKMGLFDQAAIIQELAINIFEQIGLAHEAKKTKILLEVE